LQNMRTYVGSLSTNEVLYQGIFRDAAAAHNLKLPPLYPLPITGAANYSFLYALLRLLMETPCSRLLEIGVGQSTLLVDAVRKMRGNIDVISIDTDSAWVSHIAGRVGHPVLHAPLIPKLIHGKQVMGFDLPELHGKFDAVIVDGPKQTKRNSRWAALEILDHYLADEFLVLFDDAGRPGDQDLMREFARTCKRQDLDTRFVQASRTQCLIFTPAFRAAKFF